MDESVRISLELQQQQQKDALSKDKQMVQFILGCRYFNTGLCAFRFLQHLIEKHIPF